MQNLFKCKPTNDWRYCPNLCLLKSGDTLVTDFVTRLRINVRSRISNRNNAFVIENEGRGYEAI